jgi:hypothetical protein
MRRLLLFAALLSLVGLSTAFAASLSTRAEDVDSFSTAVSISVPQNQLLSYYLSGAESVLPGLISQSPPPSSSVNSKSIDPGSLDTQAQTDTGKMHSWQTDPVPAGGLVLSGPATARIFQNGGDDPITAALFVCPTLSTTATSLCTRVTNDVSATAATSGEVAISFGNISKTLSAGQRLRLVVVNRGAHKYNLQWGYKTNRESRLDLTVAP